MTTLLVISVAALAAIWGLYPLAVGLVASFVRGHRADDRDWQPSVAVVIATRDDAATIRSRVDDCLAARYPADRLRIVVALDGGARVGEVRAALADLGDRVAVVEGDEPGGKAATLNAGVRRAEAQVLVFADAHQRFHPDAIAHLVRRLRDPAVGAVSGLLELRRAGRPTPAEVYWRVERWLRSREAVVHSAVGVTGAVYACRLEVWTPLPPGLILDDVYTPMRLVLQGYRIAFEDRAVAFETRIVERTSEFRRKVRTLTGVFQLCAWLPGVLVPFRNPIWLQFTFHKLLRFLTPYLAIAAAVAATVLVLRWLATQPEAAVGTAVALVLLLLWSTVARPQSIRAAGRVVAWAVSLQAAILVASVNGVRGRWDVWRR